MARTPPVRRRVAEIIDLTRSRRNLATAASGWLAAAEAALTAGDALPALPDELVVVRSLERLCDMSRVRQDVVRALVADGHDYAVCDQLWDVMVWQLAAHSESILRDELEQLARTDPLTGLLNRRGLAEVLDRETARSRRMATPVSLVVIDLDRFKQLNDTWGHGAGDAALRALADLLHRGLRAGDVAGRWGGDEFAIVLAGVEADQALDVVDRIRATFTHPSFRAVLRRGSSFSAGVAALAGEDAETARLMEIADAALYAAKAAGGNRARCAAARPLLS